MTFKEFSPKGTIGIIPRENILGPRLLAEIPRPNSETIQLSLDKKVVIVDKRIILSYAKLEDSGVGKLIIDRELTEPVIKEKAGEIGTKTCIPYSKDELQNKSGEYRGLFMRLDAQSPVIYIGEQYKITFIARGEEKTHIAFSLESTEPIKLNKVNYPPVRPDIALRELRKVQSRS